MRTVIFLSFFLAFSNLYATAEFNVNSPGLTCLSCSVPDSLLVTDLTDSTATLSWKAASGATQYTVEVEDEQNGSSNFQIETSVTGTSFAVVGLKSGVLYKFKVRANCGNDHSDWSDWVFFTASNNGGGNGSNTCAIPTGLVVSVVNGVATLSWNAVPGAVKYSIEVEDEQNTPSTFHLEDFSLTNSYPLSGFQTGVQYKFKVRSHCANGQSDWSAWVFFNGTGGNQGGGSGTGACDIPVSLSASVNGASATLSWAKVTGAQQYYVEVEDEQNNPSTFHVEVSVQDTFYVVNGLQAGIAYKFKVRSHCATGQSDWSNWLFFNGNTGNGGIGSGSGNCSRPTNPKVSGITLDGALLSWTAVAGIGAYTLEIEREQGGNSAWQMTQVVTTNSYQLTGLNADTKYKFKVRSNCAGGGHSNWTKWKKFKTEHNFTDTPGGSNLPDTADDRNQKNTESIDPALNMLVWPNPVQSNTAVRLQHLNTEFATLRLLNLSGQLVQEQQIQASNGAWEGSLNLLQVANGLYLLQLNSGELTHTQKLVVSH